MILRNPHSTFVPSIGNGKADNNVTVLSQTGCVIGGANTFRDSVSTLCFSGFFCLAQNTVLMVAYECEQQKALLSCIFVAKREYRSENNTVKAKTH